MHRMRRRIRRGRAGARDYPQGDCFANAVKWARALGPDAKIIHGVVTLESGLRGAHCWAEKGGTVMDPTAGFFGKKSLYYKTVKAKPEASYTVEQALVNSLRSGHWGPWGGRDA
jgi:hypothetical protein